MTRTNQQSVIDEAKRQAKATGKARYVYQVSDVLFRLSVWPSAALGTKDYHTQGMLVYSSDLDECL